MFPLVYREYASGDRLAPFVRAYFTFGLKQETARGFALRRSMTFAGPSSVSSIMMADAATSLVISSGDEWSVDGVEASQGEVGSAILFGPMPRGLGTRIGPGINAAGVYFRAGALSRFLALPMHELSGHGLPASDVFGAAAKGAIAATIETSDPTARLQLLETILASMLRDVPWMPYSLARRFYAECLSPAGPPSVDAAAAKLGVSRQCLARQLREVVGASPKLIARIARFQNVLRAMAITPPRWAEIAVEHGYSDQSHLIADFREFSAHSPAALARTGQFHPYCL